MLSGPRWRGAKTITFGQATVQRRDSERRLAERRNPLRFDTITACLFRMHDGHPFPALAEGLHMSLRTVSHWLSLCIRRRFAGRGGHHCAGRGRKAPRNTAQRQRVYALIAKGPLASGFPWGGWTSSMIAVLIARAWGGTSHPRSVCRRLPHRGRTSQKAAFVSDTRDDEEPQRTRQTWERKTWPAIVKRAQALKAVILCGDAVSCAPWGALARPWAPRGQQPKVPTCGKRKGMKVFGAIEVQHGAFLSREWADTCHGEASTGLFKEVLSP